MNLRSVSNNSQSRGPVVRKHTCHLLQPSCRESFDWMTPSPFKNPLCMELGCLGQALWEKGSGDFSHPIANTGNKCNSMDDLACDRNTYHVPGVIYASGHLSPHPTPSWSYYSPYVYKRGPWDAGLDDSQADSPQQMWDLNSGEGNGKPLQYSCLENPMDSSLPGSSAHGVTRVGHDLATKPLSLAKSFYLSVRPSRVFCYCWEIQKPDGGSKGTAFSGCKSLSELTQGDQPLQHPGPRAPPEMGVFSTKALNQYGLQQTEMVGPRWPRLSSALWLRNKTNAFSECKQQLKDNADGSHSE